VRKKTFLIARQEFVYVITRPWFLLMLIGLPLLIFGQMFLFQRMGGGDSGPGSGPGEVQATVDLPSTAGPQAFGYVDQGGLIENMPAQVPAGLLVAFPDQAGADRAMENGDISAYFLVAADYVQTGELVEVRPDFSPLMPSTAYRWMNWVLLANLLEGDIALAERVWNPMDLQSAAPEPVQPAEAQSLADEEAEDEARVTSMLILLLFYAVIAIAASFLLRSISEEKKNRTMEILLLSASPRQILTGKTVALGLAGLVQACGWGVIGYALFSLGGMSFRLPAGMVFTPALLAWSGVFLLLGYAVYASVFAGAGALVPNWRDASGVTLVLILPALIGFEIALFQADTPHSGLMTGASLFPLTAPFTMIKRLMSGGVPLWQLLLSGGLMAATAYLITQAVARMFHAQNLLSGQPFSTRRYFRALLRRE
jgi:ABC-2 type transport system permease protein